jgi:hypothetical protein
VLAVTDAAAQPTLPVLRYMPPANAYRAVTAQADDYAFNGFNASVQIYPFRPFTGDIQQAFQMTLLRDWIMPQYQEENVGAPPAFATAAVPGADLTIVANFVENIVGLPHPHTRMLIIVGNQAAIVDASAGTAQSWQAALPFLITLGDSLRVEAGAAHAPAPLTAAAGRAVAGLYMGMKQKYTVNTIGGGHYYKTALHYYLLSADGRVYRAYDVLNVPEDIADFDFDTAERNDQENSGRYTIDGGKLVICMAGQQPETVVTDAPRDGRVTINEVIYQRQ